MSATPPATRGHAELGEAPIPPRPSRRRRWLAMAVVVVIVVGVGAYVEQANPDGISLAHPLGVQQHAAAGTQDNSAGTSTATVQQRSLSATTSVSGTLGYAGSYTVFGQAHGTVTWLPAVGQVLHEGQVLYRVDGNPVVVLYGSLPAYRALAEGNAGSDVRELNADLVAMGYIRTAEVSPYSHQFTAATTRGLERLQHVLGLSGTGKLALGDYVFLPNAARVTTVTAKLGGPASGPVMTTSSTARQVTVNLDASQQSQVKTGDAVTITLPNNRTTPGTVTSVGTVAITPPSSGSGSSSTPTITVDITPTDPAATGTLDQAPVQVAITTATMHDVLVVPVAALLALGSGGYAVEVVNSNGTHHLAPVTLGLFDDAAGLVQVTGTGLAAGDRAVVPAS